MPTQPSRQKPATTNASAAASAVGLAVEVATEPSAAAVISAVVDSGPTDSWREEPRTAYTRSAPMAAHNPATAGRPASSA